MKERVPRVGSAGSMPKYGVAVGFSADEAGLESRVESQPTPPPINVPAAMLASQSRLRAALSCSRTSSKGLAAAAPVSAPKLAAKSISSIRDDVTFTCVASAPAASTPRPAP